MAEQREESQGFFEMLWNCEFCDTKGLLAKSQRFCANCGGPQNPDKRYFPQEGQEVRVDGHKFEGADRTCPACSSPMGAAARNCTHCGSPLDGSAEVRGVVDAARPAAAAKPVKAKRKGRRIWPIILGAIVLIGIAIWFRFLRTHEAQVEVSGHSWKREVSVDEYKDGTESGWRTELPGDATLPQCHEKEHGTKQTPDGEECHNERHDKKDGTFEQVKKCSPKTKSEPVMDQWCTYTARRWRPVSTMEAHGAGMTPAWPANIPPADLPVQLGGRRAGKRTETNTLEFAGHGTCDVAEDVWRKYKDGQKLKVEVRPSGDVACGSL